MNSIAKQAALEIIGAINENVELFNAEVMSALYNNNKSANRRSRKQSIMLRSQIKELRKLLLAIEKEQ